MKNLDVQLQVLDDILGRVRTQNGHHHEAHIQSLASLSSTVSDSYSSLGDHLQGSSKRAHSMQQDTTKQTTDMLITLEPLHGSVITSLAGLRTETQAANMAEYTSTGSTPQKTQYQYPTALPTTESHDVLLARYRNGASAGSEPRLSTTPLQSPVRQSSKSSPTKSIIFTDDDPTPANSTANAASATSSPSRHRPQLQKSGRTGSNVQNGLREIDVNVAAAAASSSSITSQEPTGDTSRRPSQITEKQQQPPLKRQNTGLLATGKTPAQNMNDVKEFASSVGFGNKLPKRAVAEGRENMPFGASVGVGGGRQLRNRNS